MKLTFAKEARLSLGCAAVLLQSGEVVGCRCEPYSYTNKWLLNVHEWDVAVEAEIAHIRALPGDASEWVTDKRCLATSGIYTNDSVTVMPGVGAKLADRSLNVGLSTVGDLALLSNVDIDSVALASKGVSTRRLFTLRSTARLATIGTYVDVSVDHRQARNPYLSRYGASWEMKIANSPALSKFASVKSLIHHIVKASQHIMEGTKYHDNGYWYHDALPQLRARCTMEWLAATNLLDRWVRPELDLNKGTVFAGRPVGNSPELMPWDSSLNKDLKDQLKRHVMFTYGFNSDDPRKFSKATPQSIEDAVRRLLLPSDDPAVGAPSGRHIVEDVVKCTGRNLLAIIDADGAVVHGLGKVRTHLPRHGKEEELEEAKQQVPLQSERCIHESQPKVIDALEILKFYHANGRNQTHSARHFQANGFPSLNQSTVSRFVRDGAKWRYLAEKEKMLDVVRVRAARLPRFDAALSMWHERTELSEGWSLMQFKARNNLRVHRFYGEAAAISVKDVDKKRARLRVLLTCASDHGYDINDITISMRRLSFTHLYLI
ncbi:hypothetical protein ACHHYP_20518 [Achlya hypogyna]|uniref:Uncharacterized protein n=1 Tax=Achlya hypogyna TaxID=1202772 RepID=A0A1V9YK12_ACHHY|nr:hypothetical protein ACHHYP_20518 [Achlya hypogyna]